MSEQQLFRHGQTAMANTRGHSFKLLEWAKAFAEHAATNEIDPKILVTTKSHLGLMVSELKKTLGGIENLKDLLEQKGNDAKS